MAMVDRNWVRVIKRAFEPGWMSDYRYDQRLQQIALAVVVAAQDAATVNWALLDLGAMVCRPRNPRCGTCPLAGRCTYAKAFGPNRTGRHFELVGPGAASPAFD
jgi:A/G-specific adenine glycosylase